MASKKRNSSSMKKLHKETSKHLSEDIRGYQKQRKNLKKEIDEDKKLKKKLKLNKK